MDEQATTQTAPAADAPQEETLVFSTVRFGEVTIPKSRVLSFPRGLVGMPSAKNFVFLHQEDANSPFFWMQSVDDPRLAFVVCEPQLFFPGYTVPLSGEEQQFLGIQKAEDGTACVILVVPSDPREITANLRGPIIINSDQRVGVQLVLAGDEYPTRAPLFQAEEGGAACSS